MLTRLLLVVAVSALAACHAPASAKVARLLAGSYSSAAQAKADPEFFEVHLHMAPIWTARLPSWTRVAFHWSRHSNISTAVWTAR